MQFPKDAVCFCNVGEFLLVGCSSGRVAALKKEQQTIHAVADFPAHNVGLLQMHYLQVVLASLL